MMSLRFSRTEEPGRRKECPFSLDLLELYLPCLVSHPFDKQYLMSVEELTAA